MEPDEVEGDEDPGNTSEMSASQESAEGSSTGKKSRFSKDTRDYMRMTLGTRRTDGSIRLPLKCPKNKDIKVANTKIFMMTLLSQLNLHPQRSRILSGAW